MKQFIYKGIAILLLVVLIDVAVGAVSGKIFTSLPDKNSMIATIQQSLFKKKADVLILGPSTANHNYNALMMSDSLGMNVYNAGLDGRDMIYSDVVLQSYLDRCDLKAVLLDIGPVQLDGSWIDRIHDTKPYYGINKHVTDYYDNETDWQQRLKLLSSLYRYNKTLSYWIRVQIDPVNNSKGYAPLYGRAESINPSMANCFEVDSTEYSHLKNIVDVCAQRNIWLVLIESPSESMNTTFEDWIKRFCLLNGVELLGKESFEDFYNHPEWFKDANHLNSDGADVFTKIIISKIK